MNPLNKQREIVLYEPIWAGHNPTYTKLLSVEFLKAELNVVALVPKPDELVTWIEDNCRGNENFIAHQIPEYKGGIAGTDTLGRNAWRYIKPAIEWINKSDRKKNQFLYLNVGDRVFNSPAVWPLMRLRCRVPWAGLYMQPLHRVNEIYKCRRNTFRLKLMALTRWSGCKFISTLDEGVLPKLQSSTRVPVLSFPDITDETQPSTSEAALELIQFASGLPIVGLFGIVAPWKGVGEFLRLAEQWDETPVVFAIAGPISDEYRRDILPKIEELKRRGKRVWTLFRHINDGEEYNSLVGSSRVIWAVYPGHYHSSNNLTKSALFHKPVLCGSHGLMGERVKKYNLGECVQVHDLESYIDGLKRLLSSEDKTRVFSEYFTTHSRNELTRKVKEMLPLF